MKVIFLLYSAYNYGGIPKVAISIANELSKYMDISLVSIYRIKGRNAYPINQEIKQIILYDNVNSPLSIKKNMLGIIRKINYVVNQSKAERLVVCGMNYIYLALYSVLMNRKSTKLVAWEHSNYYHGKIYHAVKIGRFLSKRFAYKIVSLTQEDKSIYENHGYDNVQQIYNIIPESFPFIKNKKRKYSIISCGALVEQKGFDMLLDVALSVKKNIDIEWCWDIYGEGSDLSKLEKKRKELGLENIVSFKGLCTNMNDAYEKYDFFVLTSRYEGFVGVLIEALQHHLPVISFACHCGPRDIFFESEFGYLVDMGDIEEMGKGIITLLKNDLLFEKFRKNACLDNRDDFKKDYIVNQWLHLLNGDGNE